MTDPAFAAGEIREQQIRGLTEQLRTARRRAQRVSPHTLKGHQLRAHLAQLERELAERSRA